MKPLVSVIVPVYRVEKYLKKCVDSLLAQTYENFEIILVDDGSDDNCPQICDNYAAHYLQVRTLHKTNGGLSDARNYGTLHAKGSYITFVDGDDYVTRTYIADLMYLVQTYHVDIAIMDWLLVDENDSFLDIVHESEEIELMDTVEALQRMFYRKGFGVSACSKIYKKELVVKHPYPLDTYYEDRATTYKMICECSQIVFSHKVGYYYVQHSGSIMHRTPSKYELRGLNICEDIIKYMAQYYPDVVPAARSQLMKKILEYIPQLLSNSKEEHRIYKILRHYASTYYLPVMKDNNVSVFIKIRITSLMLGYTPLKFTWKTIAFLKRIIISSINQYKSFQGKTHIHKIKQM